MQASLSVWNRREPIRPHIYRGGKIIISYMPARTCHMWIVDGSQGIIGMGLSVKDACTAYRGALELWNSQNRQRLKSRKRKVLPDPLLPFPRMIGDDARN